MPYFLRKKNGKTCVVEGTKEDPGEEKKCYADEQDAKDYLAALYANVEDAEMKEDVHQCVCPDCGHVSDVPLGEKCKEQECPECGTRMIQKTSGTYKDAVYGILRLYKEEKEKGRWQDRWVAVTTVEMWDREGERFSTAAMDYEIAHIAQRKEYPEFRMFHVRGFQLGMCDSMQRIGQYAVDQGYWYDTPFAQAVKEVVARNKGRWKISRGFYPVEASGYCPECGEGLTVGPINYIVGVLCHACKEWHTPSKLKQLTYLKTRTFDITVTDVPAVVRTAVAAYTIGSQ